MPLNPLLTMLKIWQSDNPDDLNFYASLNKFCAAVGLDPDPELYTFGVGISGIPDQYLIQSDGIRWFVEKYPHLKDQIKYV